jgi:hypothetical protein
VFLLKNKFLTVDGEAGRQGKTEGGPKGSVAKSKISIAILWTRVLTPFCDCGHFGLGAHFSYCMKEKSEQSEQSDLVRLVYSCILG